MGCCFLFFDPFFDPFFGSLIKYLIQIKNSPQIKIKRAAVAIVPPMMPKKTIYRSFVDNSFLQNLSTSAGVNSFLFSFSYSNFPFVHTALTIFLVFTIQNASVLSLL